MGTWGNGIFDSDRSCDIYDTLLSHCKIDWEDYSTPRHSQHVSQGEHVFTKTDLAKFKTALPKLLTIKRTKDPNNKFFKFRLTEDRELAFYWMGLAQLIMNHHLKVAPTKFAVVFQAKNWLVKDTQEFDTPKQRQKELDKFFMKAQAYHEKLVLDKVHQQSGHKAKTPVKKL